MTALLFILLACPGQAAPAKERAASLTAEAERVLASGSARDAKKLADQACLLDAGNPRAFMARARAEMALGLPLRAEDTMSRVLVLGFDRPEAHRLLAQAYLTTGHAPEAFRHAERAAALAPKDGGAYLDRALARAALGEPLDRVLDDCSRAAALAPSLAARCPLPGKAWSGGAGGPRPPAGSAAGPYAAALAVVGGLALVLFDRSRGN